MSVSFVPGFLLGLSRGYQGQKTNQRKSNAHPAQPVLLRTDNDTEGDTHGSLRLGRGIHVTKIATNLPAQIKTTEEQIEQLEEAPKSPQNASHLTCIAHSLTPAQGRLTELKAKMNSGGGAYGDSDQLNVKPPDAVSNATSYFSARKLSSAQPDVTGTRGWVLEADVVPVSFVPHDVEIKKSYSIKSLPADLVTALGKTASLGFCTRE